MQKITRHALRGAAVLGLLLGLSACPGERKTENPLLHDIENPSKTVQEGCDLARQKCTRCHTMERILVTHPSNAHGWRRYVRRMRLMPSADIQEAEEPKIVKCLVFRAFGAEGLASLEGEAP